MNSWPRTNLLLGLTCVWFWGSPLYYTPQWPHTSWNGLTMSWYPPTCPKPPSKHDEREEERANHTMVQAGVESTQLGLGTGCYVYIYNLDHKFYVVVTPNASPVCSLPDHSSVFQTKNDVQWEVSCAQPYSGAEPSVNAVIPSPSLISAWKCSLV